MSSSGGGGRVSKDAAKMGDGATREGEASREDKGSKGVESTSTNKKGSPKEINIPKEPLKDKPKSIEEILSSLQQPPSDAFKAKLKLKIGNSNSSTANVKGGNGSIRSSSSRTDQEEDTEARTQQRQGQGQSQRSATMEEENEKDTSNDMHSLNLPLPINPNFKVRTALFPHSSHISLLSFF